MDNGGNNLLEAGNGFEKVLSTVDTVLKQEPLSHIQELVILQSWHGRTYVEIAKIAGRREF